MTTQNTDSQWLDELLQSIEDYCVTGALGGSPFNSPEENDKLRNDAVYEGRAEAKATIALHIQAAEREARLSELSMFDLDWENWHMQEHIEQRTAELTKQEQQS